MKNGSLTRWMLAAAIVAAGLTALAIETEKVDLRDGAENDGAVAIRREGASLVLKDAENGEVTLSELLAVSDDHGALDGLADDDHPQYLDSPRHAAAHDATFNAALAIPPDGGGNTTLGAHAGDANLHLRRAAAEAISGAWTFGAPIEFTGGAVRVRAASSGANSVLHLGASGASGALTWSPTAARFDFSDTLAAPVLDGTAVHVQTSLLGNPSGTRTAALSGFSTVEGIAWNNLLSRAAAENVTGAWSFLAPAAAIIADGSTATERHALRVEMDATLDPDGELPDRRRAALDARLTIDSPTSHLVTGLGAAAVRAEAQVAAETEANTSGVVAGVAGLASAAGEGVFGAVGVAGIAGDSTAATRRVGVFGALDEEALSDPSELPEGDHAGVFLGGVLVRGALVAEATRWEDRAALAAVGHGPAWTAEGDGLGTTTHGAVAYFALPLAPGSRLLGVRVKWTGTEPGDNLLVRVLKRAEDGAAASFSVVGEQQTFEGTGEVALETYALEAAESVPEGTSFTLEAQSVVPGSAVILYAVGWQTAARGY